MDKVDFIKNRRSIRRYDENYKLTDEEFENIILLAGRAPSSGNLQPWRVVIVRSDEGKNALEKVMLGNFLQLQTSSAMIAVFYDKNEYSYVDKIYSKAVKEGLMPEDVAKKQISGLNKQGKTIDEWHKLRDGFVNTGIFVSQLINSIRAYGYAAGPMRGFNEEKIAETLGLDRDRYLPVAIVSCGKPAEDGFPSERLDFKDIATFK